jgi:hypothetical protein
MTPQLWKKSEICYKLHLSTGMSSLSFLELLMNYDIMNCITKTSVLFAVSEHNPTFHFSLEEMHVHWNPLPECICYSIQRRMHWEVKIPTSLLFQEASEGTDLNSVDFLR